MALSLSVSPCFAETSSTLPKISGLSVSILSDQAVSLSWNKVKDNSKYDLSTIGYNIYRSEDSKDEASFELIAHIPDNRITVYIDANFNPQSVPMYRVCACKTADKKVFDAAMDSAEAGPMSDIVVGKETDYAQMISKSI